MADTLPQTMQAMALESYGDAHVLKLCELPRPIPGSNDLLIRVRASSLNPLDYKVRHDGHGIVRKFPVILGFDASGEVLEVGASVKGFQPGDAVFGLVGGARQGANAQFAVLDYRSCALKPQRLNFDEAAAIPVACLTAWEAIVDKMRVQAGQTVFITGGAGGVGHFAVQIAKLHGARVLTTAGRPQSRDFLQALGADVIIDYKKEDLVKRIMDETQGRGCEACFDCVGGALFDTVLEVLALHGQVVNITRTNSENLFKALFIKSATLHCENLGAAGYWDNGPELERIGQKLSQ
ncbi:MAG TPA: zinc-binding dehydrogenase, partial [Opitutales bacterium]|nr:zinc-binding dehydrogenase [Opitutales bacterium]